MTLNMRYAELPSSTSSTANGDACGVNAERQHGGGHPFHHKLSGEIVARFYQMHRQDQIQIQGLRSGLRRLREAEGLTHAQLGARVGKQPDFIFDQENQRRDSPYMSSLQLWASAFDLRIEFGLEDFWMHAWDDKMMRALYAMSRNFDRHDMQRLWLVSALGCWRRRMGIPAGEVGKVLDVSAEAIVRWESDAHDPFANRLFIQARAIGTRLTWKLWNRDEWMFS